MVNLPFPPLQWEAQIASEGTDQLMRHRQDRYTGFTSRGKRCRIVILKKNVPNSPEYTGEPKRYALLESCSEEQRIRDGAGVQYILHATLQGLNYASRISFCISFRFKVICCATQNTLFVFVCLLLLLIKLVKFTISLGNCLHAQEQTFEKQCLYLRTSGRVSSAQLSSIQSGIFLFAASHRRKTIPQLEEQIICDLHDLGYPEQRDKSELIKLRTKGIRFAGYFTEKTQTGRRAEMKVNLERLT